MGNKNTLVSEIERLKEFVLTDRDKMLQRRMKMPT